MTEVTANAKPVLTKEEKLAKISASIAALQAKYDDVLNDRVSAKKAAKVAYLPNVGERVLATVGRNTANKQATVVEGVVVAVKLAELGEDGKTKGATQVRVQFGEGFDVQLVTLYPAQLQAVPADAISDRPLGELPV